MDVRPTDRTGPIAERWAEGPALMTSIWRYRWLVLAATVLLGTAGFLVSDAQDEVYEATSEMFLTNVENAGVFGQAAQTDQDRYLPQQAERVTSTPVLTAAAELLGEGTSPADVARRVEAEGDAELATVSVTARAGSAERAAAIANAVVTAYQDTVASAQLERVGRATSELEQAASELEEQIAEVQANAPPLGLDGEVDDTTASQLGVLAQRLAEIDALRQQLEVDARLFGSGVEFVEQAEPPGSPVAPTPRRTAAATAVLGALLASALAYWLANRRRRVMSRDEPGLVLGVPLLGVLPTYQVAERGTLRQRTSLDPRTAEAYRFVYSSLEATLRQLGARSVMITSGSPSTGKTETALQIAATARRRDRDVLLIDADLRMRGLTAFLRAERSPGLRDLEQRGVDPPSLVARYPLGHNREMSVLTSGQGSVDGNEALSETWFERAFDQLVEAHEMTVVDSPPLLAVADTAMIAGYTDAIVLVIREGSDIDELERIQQRLRFVKQRLVGYVYLAPHALDDTAFDYGLVRAKAWDAPASQPSTDDRDDARDGRIDGAGQGDWPLPPVRTPEPVSDENARSSSSGVSTGATGSPDKTMGLLSGDRTPDSVPSDDQETEARGRRE